MYCCRSNSASNLSNCSDVKMVLTLFFFPDDFFCKDPEINNDISENIIC